MKTVINLISKNIKSGGSKLILPYIGYLLIGGLFIRQFYRWELYMMIGYLLMSWMASLPCFNEKKGDADIFISSLPVTRNHIITARYLTSMLIILLGFFIWYLNAYIWDTIYPDEINLFEKITYIKVGFMAVLFMTVQQSIFLPGFFSLKTIPLVFVFIISMALPVFLIATYFAPYKSSYNPYFTTGDLSLIIIFSVIIIAFSVLAFSGSRNLFNKKDL